VLPLKKFLKTTFSAVLYLHYAGDREIATMLLRVLVSLHASLVERP